MLQEVVQHTIECPVSALPWLSKLATAHSVQAILLSQSGKVESIHRIQPSGPSGLFETIQFKDYAVLTESDYVWEADSGELFCPEVDQKIKGAYRQAHRNGSLFAGFSHNDIQYTVDFTSLQMSKAHSLQTIHLRQRPPIWYYWESETGFIKKYEDENSAIIEEMYRYGGVGVPIGGIQYTFIFSEDKSYQVEVSTLIRKMMIARHPPVSSNLNEIRVAVLLYGNSESLSSVLVRLTQLCQLCYSCRFSSHFPLDGSTQRLALHQIANVTRRYCVSAQYDLVDNEIVAVLQGAVWYVETVAALVHSLLRDELQKHIASLHAEVQQCVNTEVQKYVASANIASEPWPELWEPHSPGEDYKLVPVKEESPEWKEVLDRMRDTLPSAEIFKLDRVQNWPLWQKYALEKKQMNKRNTGEINEESLFHGTSERNPQEIAFSLRGVDFRYSNKGMWGVGAYFAVNARYSDQNYIHRHGPYKQLILVKVLTGKSIRKEPDRSLTKPPELPGGKPEELYDTVNGETNGSVVYVVYDHDKSYPAYIITYKSV